ncbi:MAG TPA: ATP-binding protein [Gammaproteobacteria bacterium]|nr:ATP-binding protein [Gammaproteobacteria bacterium]
MGSNKSNATNYYKEWQAALHYAEQLEISVKNLQAKNQAFEKIIYSAKESDRLKNEFIANISHEMRTPLNAIIGFSEILKDGLLDTRSPRYHEFLNDIVDSANHLLVFINDVLDLAKIESNKMEFHPEKTDLYKLIKNIRKIFYKIIADKNIQFEIKMDPALNEIIIDPKKLKQVFYNYISNALKFTPPDGRVTVNIARFGKKNFRLEVQDSGIGIREEDLKKLFVKFQQLDIGSKKSYQGTGLGLALTKKIVEAQGGQVGVESLIGKGSTFFAVLPCFPYYKTWENDKTKGKGSPENNEQVPAILVIEQASQAREFMVNALIQAGYHVVISNSTEEAIKKNMQHPFNAIILDLFQPDSGSFELIRTLRSKIAAHDIYPTVIKAILEPPIQTGCKIRDFLVKPSTQKELLSALSRIEILAGQNKMILIIDSDQEALLFAHTVLSKAGFRVISRKDKVGALLALEQECPDVVLLDPYASGMDGSEFLRYYRQTERGLFTPVIIWSTRQLSDEEQLHFNASIQRVMIQGEDLNISKFIGVEKYLPQSEL